MRKALWTLGGAMLLTGLLSVPAMARPFWQSDLVCTSGDDHRRVASPVGPTPYAVILAPSGDLSVSTIHGLPPDTKFKCVIECEDEGRNRAFCGKTDANGKLSPQRIAGFASAEGLGLDRGDACVEIEFAIISDDDDSRSRGGDDAACVAGFVPPGGQKDHHHDD